MFDDLPLKKQTHDFPRNLDGLSVSELEDYTVALQDEITRVQNDMNKKKSSQDVADSIFKS